MKIKELRKKNKLTQLQLSSLTQLPVKTIQRAEAGADIRISTAIKLAKALNTDLNKLFEDRLTEE